MPSQLPSATLTLSPIPTGLLRKVYEADQEIYPVPLPFPTLHSWTQHVPDLSIAFHATYPSSGSAVVVVGTIVVLPLRKNYWNDLLVGTLKESDIRTEMLVQRERREEVGLHVFHVERFEGWREACPSRRFTDVALEAVGEVVKGTEWEVLGFSALTASHSGRATFKKLGFKSTGYQEMFLKSKTGEILTQYVHPSDDSNPQSMVGAVGPSLDILNASEMVVRYRA